jgi:hypothetical protein
MLDPMATAADQARQARHQEAAALARRREAAAALWVASAICADAATRLGDQVTPEAARQAACSAADELAAVAKMLRRLCRPGPKPG